MYYNFWMIKMYLFYIYVNWLMNAYYQNPLTILNFIQELMVYSGSTSMTVVVDKKNYFEQCSV